MHTYSDIFIHHILVTRVNLHVLKITDPGKAAAFFKESLYITVTGRRTNRIMIRQSCYTCEQRNRNFYFKPVSFIEIGTMVKFPIQRTAIYPACTGKIICIKQLVVERSPDIIFTVQIFFINYTIAIAYRSQVSKLYSSTVYFTIH